MFSSGQILLLETPHPFIITNIQCILYILIYQVLPYFFILYQTIGNSCNFQLCPMFRTLCSQNNAGLILLGHGFQHVALSKSMRATLGCMLSMAHGLRPQKVTMEVNVVQVCTVQRSSPFPTSHEIPHLEFEMRKRS